MCAAACAQIGSFITTYIFVGDLVGSGAAIAVTTSSIVAELVVTAGKFSNGSNQARLVVFCAHMFDTLLNAGGSWRWAQNIGRTQVSTMFADALALQPDSDTGANLSGLAVALVFGLFLSVAPGYFLAQAKEQVKIQAQAQVKE